MKNLLSRLLQGVCQGICLTSLMLNSVQAAEDEIYLGSVAMDVPAAMVQRLTPLTVYLSNKTGLKINFREIGRASWRERV